MRYAPPLEQVRLLRRYKRFLADIERSSGETLCVHCANPGSMMGLTEPGSVAFISDSQNPKRKLRHSLELIQTVDTLVNVNTARANALVAEALSTNHFVDFGTVSDFRPEPRLPSGSRLDFLLQLEDGALYLEVKSVTLSRQEGLAEFPDAKTTRGARHLEELVALRKSGTRAAMLFLVQRGDCERFSPAKDIDPAYAAALAKAKSEQVELLCYACSITPEGMNVGERLPISLS